MRKTTLALLAALATGCDDKSDETGQTDGTDGTDGGSPVEGDARVERSCAPDDGAAYEFQIGLDGAGCESTPSGPWLRITVWADLEPMAGGAWDLDPASGVAGVWFDPGDGSFQGARAGSLTVSTWDETAGANGRYRLILEDGSRLSGDFEADACLQEQPPCG